MRVLLLYAVFGFSSPEAVSQPWFPGNTRIETSRVSECAVIAGREGLKESSCPFGGGWRKTRDMIGAGPNSRAQPAASLSHISRGGG